MLPVQQWSEHHDVACGLDAEKLHEACKDTHDGKLLKENLW
jgi:hypothetical protein